ncbi:MAG: YfiR family protein [Candidatus Korobacteraceae bacterium]
MITALGNPDNSKLIVSNPTSGGNGRWSAWGFLLLLAIRLLAGSHAALAQAERPTEYTVKAAYLFNFVKFIEWPAGVVNDNLLRVCVLGNGPLGPALEQMVTGATANGKVLQAIRITRPGEAVACQVLFLSASEDGRLREVLEALGASAVLTVSDLPLFSQRGGMIELVLEQGRVRFEVNLAAANAANLTLSSELLKLARRVRTTTAGRG